MTTDNRPIGQRYTHVYLDKPSRVTDAPRARNRIAEFFYAEYGGRTSDALRGLLRSELGVPIGGSYSASSVRDFLKAAELHDFLDALTVIWTGLNELDKEYRDSEAARWVGFVNRVMSETGVSFELDNRGGVHPRVDAAFVANRQSALARLEATKFAAARAHFDEAYQALDGASPNTGHAIREMHLAIETIFKQAFPKASRIDVGEINTLLKPRAAERLTGPELEAAKLMLTSAGNFVSAGHQYRHASGEPEPAPPSLEFAVWMLSQGTAFLRWLIHFLEAEAAEA
jgi:hypothetical protein